MDYPYEIFPRSLVKNVIFQIKFPNLFYLKDRIGDFQTKIMKDFPESNLIIRRPILITTETDKDKRDKLVDDLQDESASSVWQFKSERGVVLEITKDSLSLVSLSHKSYSSGDQPFKNIIDTTAKSFLELVKIPIIKRIGLRYIDEGPIPENNTASFLNHYNTAFPLQRFSLEQSEEMSFVTIVQRDPHKLRYKESFKGNPGEQKLILDFDAWAENINSTELLKVADELHDILWREFRDTVKEPVLEYMRESLESSNHG